MIPASCNSSPPTSHFNGDCVTTCPGGVGTYDPYFDPSQTACPAPGVGLLVSPSRVPYGVGYSSLTLTTSGASRCDLYYIWDGDSSWTYAGSPPVNYTWGASGGLGNTLTYGVACYNGATNGSWAQSTVIVQPQIPSSPVATCNNPQGTSATLSWGASANANWGYLLRIEVPASEACPAGWQRGGDGNTCYPNPDSYGPTSYTFNSTPNQFYSWWVHGLNNRTYSDNAVGTGFTCHTPSGTITLSSPSCAIATGASNCNINASWNVSYPFGGNVSTLVRDNPNRTDYTQDTATNVPVTVYGPPTSSLTHLSLVNSGVTLDSTTATASCAAGANNWDTINNMCADPQVPSASIIGQYYPPGTLNFTCSGSDHYSVDLNGSSYIPVTPYTGPVTVTNITTAGNYVIKCSHGSVTNQVARAYASVPPPAIVSLSVSPSTLSKQDDVTVNWSTVFPTNACTLTAKVVCANNSCTAAQIAEENNLNAILTATTTDANDPSGSRSVQTAITTVAPGHLDNSTPIITVDWKALGKKTLRILYTTDLTYWCSPTSKETKRIQVTKSMDQ
jgi:hypothetical protein